MAGYVIVIENVIDRTIMNEYQERIPAAGPGAATT